MTVHPTIEAWIASDAIPFSLDTPGSLDAATDRLVAALDPDTALLGLTEALHGSEEILLIRNRMLQRLVDGHGYSAVAIEASGPQARAIDDYVLGRRERSDPDVEAWFDTGFGRLDANRELIEWLRRHNAGHAATLHFYGFDIPLGQTALASPARVLDIALAHLEAADPARARTHRERITPLAGDPADWERNEAMFDPTRSIGLTPRARDLRIATLDLIADLRIQRPAFTARTSPLTYADALHHAELARKLLDAHAALATPGAYATMLGIRDVVMADTLEHIVAAERGRGKVLAFAASGHLQRGTTEWRLPPGDDVKRWWAAGSQLTEAMGRRYAVVGMALGASEPNGLAAPEPGSIEAALASHGGPMLLPTHRGRALPAPEIEHAAPRAGSTLNPTYSPLTPESFAGFDWLLFLDSTAYPRGGPSLTDWG